MDNSLKKRAIARKRRAMRVRKALKGTAKIPRLSVFKSNRHLYAQLIDDERGLTLAGIGTLSKKFKKTKFSEKSKESARELGKYLAEAAQKNGVERVIFDRGRYKFHGLIAELAGAARESGLQF